MRTGLDGNTHLVGHIELIGNVQSTLSFRCQSIFNIPLLIKLSLPVSPKPCPVRDTLTDHLAPFKVPLTQPLFSLFQIFPRPVQLILRRHEVPLDLFDVALQSDRITSTDHLAISFVL